MSNPPPPPPKKKKQNKKKTEKLATALLDMASLHVSLNI